MKLDRLIRRLVQPLFALLLIVAAPAQAEPCAFDDEDQVQTFASVMSIIDAIGDKADDALPAVHPLPERDNDDLGSGAVLAPPSAEAPISPDRAIEIGFAAHPTAPPLRHPRASPSTGPPPV